jgi:nitroreductase family protein
MNVGPRHPEAVPAELLNARYSCRGYRPDAVPRGTIEAILSLAQRTASGASDDVDRVKAPHTTIGVAAPSIDTMAPDM